MTSVMRLGLQPVRAVLVLALAVLVVTTLAVSGLVWDARDHDLTHAANETMDLARMLTDEAEQALAGPDIALRSIQERLANPYGRELPLDAAPVQLLLSSRAAGLRQVRSLFIADREGRVMSSSHPWNSSRSANVRDRSYFQRAVASRAQELIIEPVERGYGSAAWTLHLARRIDGPDGRLRAVVVASVDVGWFEELYRHMALDYVRPIGLYLVDGTLVASMPHREADLGKPAAELRRIAPLLPGQQERLVSWTSRDGSPERMAVGRVDGFPLLVSVLDDGVEALATWRETSMKIVGAGLLSTLFVIATAGALVHQLRRDEALGSALREADERYAQTVKSVMDAIVAVDETQRIVLFNPAAERMFGVPPEEAIDRPLGTLLPARSREAHARYLEAMLHSPPASRAMAPHMAITGRRANGEEFPIEATISTALVQGRVQMTAVLRDVTERQRQEERMRTLNAELRRLNTTQQAVREEERQRISLELHDELGQQLTGIKLDLSWMTRRVREGRDVDLGALDTVLQHLDASIVTVRRISTELWPRVLDDLGFEAAVRWQAAELARRTGMVVDVDLPAADLVRDKSVKLALFRIVQEALTNVARHSGASHASVRLTNDETHMLLSVSDDGRGVADAAKPGVGLLSMRERTAALGGHFEVRALPGGGTVAESWMPLPQEAVDESRETA
jgi:PAS domain S-box-containing protein